LTGKLTGGFVLMGKLTASHRTVFVRSERRFSAIRELRDEMA